MNGRNCECQEQGISSGTGISVDGCILGSNNPRAILDPTPRLPHNINIRPLNYGFVVTVGCQEFAVEDHKKMLEIIGKYLENPNEMEKKWMEKREF